MNQTAPIIDTRKDRDGCLRDMRVGEYLICDVFDRPLRVTRYLTSGLGNIYQKLADGTSRRVIF